MEQEKGKGRKKWGGGKIQPMLCVLYAGGSEGLLDRNTEPTYPVGGYFVLGGERQDPLGRLRVSFKT